MARVSFEFEILTKKLELTLLTSTNTSNYSPSESSGNNSSNYFTPISEAFDTKIKKNDNLKIAIICSHKMNAFLETHACLVEQGYRVEWFETGGKAELPKSGSAPDIQNVCQFEKTYDFIYQDLLTKTKNMTQPSKLQQNQDFTLVITCEEGVYNQIMDYMGIFVHHGVWKPLNEAVNVINIGIPNNPKETTVGALLISELVNALSSADDLDNEMDKLLSKFERKHECRLAHKILRLVLNDV